MLLAVSLGLATLAAAPLALLAPRSGAADAHATAAAQTPAPALARTGSFSGPTVPAARQRRMTSGPLHARLSAEVSYGPMIVAAARRHGLDPMLLAALVMQESAFDAAARSSAGALGLTQVMPQTARAMGVADAGQLHRPQVALELGARYLAEQIRTFGSVRLGLAAYNAGPGAVRRYGAIPPYRQTQRYVPAVLAHRAALRRRLTG